MPFLAHPPPERGKGLCARTKAPRERAIKLGVRAERPSDVSTAPRLEARLSVGRRDGRDDDMDRKRNFVGQHFWARGYFVSTVGRDEAVIRRYIRNQEAEDKRVDQLNLLK